MVDCRAVIRRLGMFSARAGPGFLLCRVLVMRLTCVSLATGWNSQGDCAERGSFVFVRDRRSAAGDLTFSHLSLIVTPLPLPATSRDTAVTEKPW